MAVNTSVFYGIVWALVGLATGLAGLALAHWLPRLDRPALESLVVSLAVLVFAGSYVNVMFLPSMLSPRSFAVDLCMVGAALLLWLGLTKAMRRRSGRASSGGSSRALAVVTVVVAGALLLIAVVPSSRRGAASVDVGPHRAGRNVLFLLVDALRADHLGCYGYERPTSANLDRLASEGALFLNAYAQGSRTKETTASIVTSYYASTHGVFDFSSVLPTSSPTMMEIARAAGYRTAVFSANSLVSPSFGFGRGVDTFYCDAPSAVGRTLLMETARNVGIRLSALGWLPRVLRSLDVLVPLRGDRYPYRGGDPRVMNDLFLSWLDEEPGRDFFAYLHYMDTHAPYAPPPPYDTMYDPGYTGEQMTKVPIFPGSMLPFDKGEPLPQAQHHNLVAHYDGAITYFDSALGELLAEIAARGLADSTLVVVVADHGEEFFDHGGWGHGQSVYNELIRVPLIMRLSSELPVGTRVETTIRQIDLLPTILGAIGVEETLEAPDFDGVNLWDLLVSARDDWAEPIVMAEVFHGHQFSRAFKAGDHKLIHARSAEGERFMLFDLLQDPGETLDIAAERPELLEAMSARLNGLTAEAASRRLETGKTEIEEGTREKLRALGYIR
jgi:arylsulfatase A-like enzyme